MYGTRLSGRIELFGTGVSRLKTTTELSVARVVAKTSIVEANAKTSAVGAIIEILVT